jgi:hypothetical protein
MRIGVSELSRQVKYLREIAADVFTNEFKSNLNTALSNLNKTLENPELAKLIASTNTFFTLMNGTTFLASADKFMDRMATLTEKVDSEDVKSIVHSFNLLLKKAVDDDFIGKIDKALDTVSSLQSLEQFAKDLASSPVFQGLLFVAPFGAILLSAITAYRKEPSDKVFKDILAVSEVNTYINLQAVRQNAGIAYGLVVNTELQPGYAQLPEEAKQDLASIKAEAKHIRHDIPPMSEDTLRYLSAAARNYEVVIKNLYEKETKQSIEDAMDSIVAFYDIDDMTVWKQLVKRIIYFNETEINFNFNLLNYDSIKRTRGERKITELMTFIAKAFETHGGNDLFYRMVKKLDVPSSKFKDIITSIPTQQPGLMLPVGFPKIKLNAATLAQMNYEVPGKGDAVRNLVNFYCNAKSLMGDEKDLSEHEKNIILLRALLEYCKNTTKYLCFPRNVPRFCANTSISLAYTTNYFFTQTIPNLPNDIPICRGDDGLDDEEPSKCIIQ